MRSRRGAGYREEAGRGRQLSHGQEELSRRSEAGEASLLGTWWVSTRCALSVLPVARLVGGGRKWRRRGHATLSVFPPFPVRGRDMEQRLKWGDSVVALLFWVRDI